MFAVRCILLVQGRLQFYDINPILRGCRNIYAVKKVSRHAGTLRYFPRAKEQFENYTAEPKLVRGR
jgi:hypothetical protein